MAQEFCEHLKEYGLRFERAKAAYAEVTAQIDLIGREGTSDDALDRLEVTTRAWHEQVKILRAMLVTLVRHKEVVLPGQDDGAPHCAVCSHEVTRLTWPEWRLDDEGAATFRGRNLPLPEQLPAC